MMAVYKKELKTYFTGMTGTIFIGFILLMTGIYTVVYNLQGRYPNFEITLAAVSFIYALAVPVLTMRSVAEEKHSKTDQLLYSLPMTMSSIVMAKYFAMVTVLAIPCGILCLYPILLCSFGTVNLVAAYAMLLAFFLLGTALIAIGMFLSSLTESQVIAAVLSLGLLLLINFMTGLAYMIPDTAAASLAGCLIIALIVGAVVHLMIKNSVITATVSVVLMALCGLLYLVKPALFEGLIPDFLVSLALFDRLTPFQNGMFDLTSIVFYGSVAALFVYLTVQSLEKKRWN